MVVKCRYELARLWISFSYSFAVFPEFFTRQATCSVNLEILEVENFLEIDYLMSNWQNCVFIIILNQFSLING